MIKRTLIFANPHHLSVRQKQLVVVNKETGDEKSVPIEDLGLVLLEHPQVTLTQAVMAAFAENNTALLGCDAKGMPRWIALPMGGSHHQLAARHQAQIAASKPMNKQLWQQTVKAKIQNQAAALQQLGAEHSPLKHWQQHVRSGDATNLEARAAAYYWSMWREGFIRDRYGEPPNNMLNYGYAVLRAAVARALAASGLLLALGIFHHNQYNPYCLADDIMEPYRPFVDLCVAKMVAEWENEDAGLPYDLDRETKNQLVALLTTDTLMEGQKSPLLIATQRTAASLAHCYLGERNQLVFPEIPHK